MVLSPESEFFSFFNEGRMGTGQRGQQAGQ